MANVRNNPSSYTVMLETTQQEKVRCYGSSMLLYSLLLFSIVRGLEIDIKPIDLVREENVAVYGENGFQDHIKEVEGSQQQRETWRKEFSMEERGLWGQKDNGDTLYYPFLKRVNHSNPIDPCKGRGFSCIEFSTPITTYFSNLGQPNINKLGTFSTRPDKSDMPSSYTQHLDMRSRQLSAYVLKFSDPEWRKQWYLQDYRTTNMPVMDHNVVPVLNMGITGEGVTVAILGEGIREHPDLGTKFDPNLSMNFLTMQRDSTPEYDFLFTGKLYVPDGNSNAGVIAMQAGNRMCGVGIAPGARIAGYKLTLNMGIVTSNTRPKPDQELSQALAYQLDKIDIYCNLWLRYNYMLSMAFGPLIEPQSAIINAISKGISEGRGRKGSIYIFPSGINRDNNNCATNGYLNNPYVITVASALQDGRPASYSQRCTAIYGTAYSGDVTTEGIPTIDANGRCVTYFTKHPAGPAIASGIIALVLQAQPSLTYRDVMHIIAMTAEVAPLADNGDTWNRNGAGFWVSNDFGFGLLNAENMVTLARNWKGVPDFNVCNLRKKPELPVFFNHKESQEFIIDASKCNGPSSDISYLEHVQVEINIEHEYRGAVYVNIISPAGTKSTLLEPRKADDSSERFKNYNIMSVHNWGENPKGEWKITVGALEIPNAKKKLNGLIYEFVLKLRGITKIPEHSPRKYAAFRLRNGKTSN